MLPSPALAAALPRLATLLILVLLAALPRAAAAQNVTGRVVSVADGDTLTLLRGREQIRVRLSEIDAPERGQPFGNRSRQSLSALCAGTTARVDVAGKDIYGRTLGRVWCRGIDSNAEQVRRGMAWVYDQYVTDRSLYALQQTARRARTGLWTDPAPVPPWLWRRGITSVSASGAPEPQSSAAGPIIGNRRSRIYHLPAGCPSYGDVSPRNRVPFVSQEAARAAGYRLARNCVVAH